MAKLLVERGCRVILFDLFGRGYSDAPDPEMYRQDIGLWSSQILLVSRVRGSIRTTATRLLICEIHC